MTIDMIEPVESVSINPADYDDADQRTVTVKWAGQYIDMHYDAETGAFTGISLGGVDFPADAFTPEWQADFTAVLRDEMQALADAAQEAQEVR